MDQPSPLEIFRRWHAGLPDVIARHIDRFLKDYLSATDEGIVRWMHGEPEAEAESVGMVVCMAGLLDFLLESQGEAYWDILMGPACEVLETSECPAARSRSNELLGRQLFHKEAWETAVEQLQELRAGALSHSALHGWDREMSRTAPKV